MVRIVFWTRTDAPEGPFGGPPGTMTSTPLMLRSTSKKTSKKLSAG
jgi:hypothetical protein